MTSATKSTASPSTAAAPLQGLFGGDPRFRLTLGDLDAYHIFRRREPHLVSLLDEGTPAAGAFDVLTFWEENTPVGSVSFLVQDNARKSLPLNAFGRIDIVIVPEAYRGLGLGRMLLLLVTAHLLQAHGDCLYSISCLAAHPAVAHTLESLGFQPDPNRSPHYVHEELKLTEGQAMEWARRFSGQTEGAIQQVRYSLRQRGRNP